MPTADPLELTQEIAEYRTALEQAHRYENVGEIIRWSITLSPRVSNDWHIVLRWYSYWTDILLGQRSYSVDDYATALQVIEAVWEEQDGDGHESDSEAPKTSA